MIIPSEEELIKEANKAPEISPWWVTVLYGDYGVRKTTTACSMVNERGLLLTTDDSWKVLLNKRHKDLLDKVNIKPLEGLSQLKYIDFEGYDTIIWDTLSHSVDRFLDLLYDEAKWNGKNREKIVTSNKELKDLEALGLADYRITRDIFRPHLERLFKETAANIIFTSQFSEPMTGVGKQQIRPAIPQATFKIVGTRADIIAHVKNTGTKHVADVSHGLTQLGKTRIETIQGSLDLDKFVSNYKEFVFK